MALRIYRAPSGLTYQFEEGKQPAGYVLVRPAAKRRAASNKAAKMANK